MRILYLCHPMHDSGEFSLYAGLCSVLGSENVVDYPWKGAYHGPRHGLMGHEWFRTAYREYCDERRPLPDGCPPLSPGEFLTTNDQREIKRDREAFYCHSDGREWPEQEVVEACEAGTFDLIVLPSGHRVPTIAYGRLRERVQPGKMPPLVFYDTGERDEFNAWWWHAFKPACSFKMCLTPAEFARYPCAGVPCKLYPLPLAYAAGPLSYDDDERPLDVLCNLGGTHGDRAEISAAVAGICDKHGFSTTARMDPPHCYFSRVTGYGEPYLSLMSACSAVVSYRGSARDTPRYWQALALGCGLVADGTMGCVHPFALRDREHAWFYRDAGELERALVDALADGPRRSAVAHAGHRVLLSRHTAEARARFFLEIVRQATGVGNPMHGMADWFGMGQQCSMPPWQPGFVIGYGQPDWHGELAY